MGDRYAITCTVSVVENLGDRGQRHDLPMTIEPGWSIEQLMKIAAKTHGGYVSSSSPTISALDKFGAVTLRVEAISNG